MHKTNSNYVSYFIFLIKITNDLAAFFFFLSFSPLQSLINYFKKCLLHKLNIISIEISHFTFYIILFFNFNKCKDFFNINLMKLFIF